MKKFFALLLALVMALSLVACGKKDEPKTDDNANTVTYPEYFTGMDDLIAAAQAEGELVVYGSCEEEYLAAACAHFQELFGIKTTYQRLSTGEVQGKIEEENGNPSADVWFGGTTDPYNICAAKGLLDPYDAVNASHLVGDMYKDADNNWFGIYIGFLHDGITQIVDNGYTNVGLVIPSSGTSFEIGATAIFKGAAHPNAAKLWIEYALSPECVELAAKNGSYQFLVIDNAEQPSQAAEFGLDPNNVMDYDFQDAKDNTTTYVEEVMNALASSGADTGADRFKTE